MPNMFARKADIKTAQGDFDIYVEKAGAKQKFDGDLSIKLVQGGVESDTATTAAPAGTATGVTLDYSLIGGNGIGTVNKTIHNGGVVVKATTAAGTTVGTYSDTSVQLKVALTGQVTGA